MAAKISGHHPRVRKESKFGNGKVMGMRDRRFNVLFCTGWRPLGNDVKVNMSVNTVS